MFPAHSISTRSHPKPLHALVEGIIPCNSVPSRTCKTIEQQLSSGSPLCPCEPMFAPASEGFVAVWALPGDDGSWRRYINVLMPLPCNQLTSQLIELLSDHGCARVRLAVYARPLICSLVVVPAGSASHFQLALDAEIIELSKLAFLLLLPSTRTLTWWNSWSAQTSCGVEPQGSLIKPHPV